MSTNLGEKYTPQYFLLAVGPGLLATFFLLFTLGQLPASANGRLHLFGILDAIGDANSFGIAAFVIGAVGFIISSLIHFFLLGWNFVEITRFRKTETVRAIIGTRNEIQFMAPLLALLFSPFALPLLFSPLGESEIGRNSVLYSMLVYYLVLGTLALIITIRYVWILISNRLRPCADGSAPHMITVQALTIISGGCAIPTSVSTDPLLNLLGNTGLAIFGTATILALIGLLVVAITDVIRHGVMKRNALAIWAPIPAILVASLLITERATGTCAMMYSYIEPGTVIGVPSLMLFTALAVGLGLQVALAAIGLLHMWTVRDFRAQFLPGQTYSLNAFALVFPAMSIALLSLYVVNVGMVANNSIVPLSPAHHTLNIALLLCVMVIASLDLRGVIQHIRGRGKAIYVNAKGELTEDLSSHSNQPLVEPNPARA